MLFVLFDFNNPLDRMGFVFFVIGLLLFAFCGWLRTKPGKRWLEEL